jgi:hypothetical protein
MLDIAPRSDTAAGTSFRKKAVTMGIVYEINNELGITFVVWRGVIDAGAFLAHTYVLSSDPYWPTPERRQISDLRGACLDASLDQAVLERAAAMYGVHSDKVASLMVAVLAHEGYDQTAAYARLLVRHGVAVSTFSLAETACTWLGADLDKVNAVLGRMRPSGSLKLD